MGKKKVRRWTRGRLMALGLPAVLIPGILISIALGWNPTKLANISDYHAIKTIFPSTGVVAEVIDGDTFTIQNGVGVRLIGIDAPNRGEQTYHQSRLKLDKIINNQRVFLEYDRYQDDKYGRVLAWVWTGCEKDPIFLPADYMHLTYNTSRLGLTENPEGCKKGILVNEEMVKDGFARVETFKERGALKYEERILRGR